MAHQPVRSPEMSAVGDEASVTPYDGVLLLSFGGPERPEDVMPFLRSVTAGRGIPDARLASVATHYLDRGGRSPINDENRALLGALDAEWRGRGIEIPLLWGNRHGEPALGRVLTEAADRGLRRLITILTSMYPSYSGCRQYREDLAAALAALPPGRRPVVDKIRPYATHPCVGETMSGLVLAAVRQLLGPDDAAGGGARGIGAGGGAMGIGAGGGARGIDTVRLVFVTHSLPAAQDERSGPGGGWYVRQHRQLAAAITGTVARELGHSPSSGAGGLGWDLAFCSRSGPPRQPWLEPDIADLLGTLPGQGVRAVAIVPIGFVSDHMEVVYDLDEVAVGRAREVGLDVVRVPTLRDHPRFVAGLVDLVLERAAQARGESPPMPWWPALPPGGTDPAVLPAVCEVGCCPNPRGIVPAECGAETVAVPRPGPASDDDGGRAGHDE